MVEPNPLTRTDCGMLPQTSSANPATNHLTSQLEKFEQLHRTDHCQDPDNPAIWPINRFKNRYFDALPFKDKRVLLQSNYCSSDYINASFLNRRQFISTQAPLPNTIADFWVMVWEQRSPVIVMLTRIVENGKQKAFRYWPVKENETEEYGDELVRITLLSEEKRGCIHVRSFNVQVLLENGEYSTPHTVQHIQYTEWPDFGVPTSTSGIRQIMSLVREAASDEPIIVHCSAGIGRSGTFIAAMIVSEKLQGGDKTIANLDLVDTIAALRQERAGMVQTSEQFKFLYALLQEHP